MSRASIPRAPPPPPPAAAAPPPRPPVYAKAPPQRLPPPPLRVDKLPRPGTAAAPASADDPATSTGLVDGAESYQRVDRVAVIAPGQALAKGLHDTDLASLDLQPLCDRLSGCLALRARSASAWAVALRLRADLLPATRLRLSGDADGRIALHLFSAEARVVDLLRARKQSLSMVLEPWSRGKPEVEVDIDTDQPG